MCETNLYERGLTGVYIYGSIWNSDSLDKLYVPYYVKHY